MDKDIAVKVENVSKVFELPHEKAGSVKTALINFRRDKGYDLQQALKDVSFEIKKGEFFGIVGRNGSGKSTLLKIIAGIYQPSEGQVNINGKLVPFIELGVGFNPELTGRENVYLNGALFGFSRKEIDRQYNDIVAFAELKPFMEQKLKNYSSGMQVRLAFSMAVRSKADILLIDEVLAVGDADFQRKCYAYFNKLKRTKKTVVFVSHDMDAVQRYCDRSLILEKSEILKIGNTREVAQDYIKLFVDQTAQAAPAAGGGKRWGEGNFKTKKVSVAVDDQKITITQKAKADKAVETPTAGIRIRSSSGQDITGTNTQLEDVILKPLKAGKTISFVWQFPNVLSDGDYFVDLALGAESGSAITDWWDEAASFTIKKRRLLPYPVDPAFDLTVEAER